MLGRAFAHGIAAMRRCTSIAIVIWIVDLAIAVTAALPVWWWLRATALRPDADTLLERLDPGTIVDLIHANGPVAVAGLAAATLLAAAVAGVAGVAVNAGLVAAVTTDDGRTPVARFLEGIGRYFWRFLRLAIVAAITGAVIFVVLLLVFGLLSRVLAGATLSFTPAARWLAAGMGAFLVTAAIVFTAMDYARLRLAAWNSRQSVEAWFASLRFVVRHAALTVSLTIAFAAIAVATLIVYAALASPAASMAGIAMLFVVRQATVLVRVAARVGLLGAEIDVWRTLGPPPPPAPVPAPAPEPPIAPPGAPDTIDVPA